MTKLISDRVIKELSKMYDDAPMWASRFNLIHDLILSEDEAKKYAPLPGQEKLPL